MYYAPNRSNLTIEKETTLGEMCPLSTTESSKVQVQAVRYQSVSERFFGNFDSTYIPGYGEVCIS
jgi:hypothetical protein